MCLKNLKNVSIAHLSEKIKEIVAGLPSVDMDRIYILGHSMGGHGTYILLQIEPGYFAAAAPSAGTGRPQTEEFIDAAVIKDIPIWAFHGDADKVCPYEREQELFAEMQQRCHRMMQAGCCPPSKEVGSAGVCCEPGRTDAASGQESRPEGQAA